MSRVIENVMDIRFLRKGRKSYGIIIYYIEGIRGDDFVLMIVLYFSKNFCIYKGNK